MKTEEDINKGNAVIALFMGGKFNDGNGVTDNTWTFEDNWLYEPLGYHASWKSLMPVVKKIRNIDPKLVDDTGIGSIGFGILSVNIESAHRAIVHCIGLLNPICECGSDDIDTRESWRRTGKPKNAPRIDKFRLVSYGYRFEEHVCKGCKHIWEGRRL